MKTTLIQTEQEKAIALHKRLSEIDIATVPVMSLDRGISRKDQAKLARELFRQLGLRDISVTAPNYSMAQSVDVSIPKRRDYVFDYHGFVVHGDAAATMNKESRKSILAILLQAFPNHVDRSDIQLDHFDSKWSVK